MWHGEPPAGHSESGSGWRNRSASVRMPVPSIMVVRTMISL